MNQLITLYSVAPTAIPTVGFKNAVDKAVYIYVECTGLAFLVATSGAAVAELFPIAVLKRVAVGNNCIMSRFLQEHVTYR